jgi:hypothetical protein
MQLAQGRLMLTILGRLAEFERELILARTGDGRKHATARGVRFGRPPALTVDQRQDAIQWLAEGATQADLARGPMMRAKQQYQGYNPALSKPQAAPPDSDQAPRQPSLEVWARHACLLIEEKRTPLLRCGNFRS